MDYSQLYGNINDNLNTGNISTDDFLAIFSSTSPTDVAGGGTGAGGGGGDVGGKDAGIGIKFNTTIPTTYTHLLNGSIIDSGGGVGAGAGAGAGISINNVTLNPPLLTINGQYTLTNILESTLSAAATTLSPGTSVAGQYINDTFFYLNNNFYNTSSSSSSTSSSSSGGGGGGGGGGVGGSGSSINIASGGINYTGGGIYNYNNQTTLANNISSNITEIHWDGRYPSGYTLTHIVIASIIVTILMIIIIVGNMLVIIAICTEKSLKNIQNWFIASLAVADFFLGLVIMPFSLANELMGYWIFGTWWCDIHSAMDVLLCTASIMNLCLISLDRYWSITKAVDYLKSRTPARAVVMIAAVWIMSALICIPPLLGWKVKMPEGELPKCALSEDIGYVLYSALGSFYIPSCIMVFVYIRIYFAAKARARRGIKKHPRKSNNEQVTSFTTASKKGTIPMPSSSGGAALQMHQQRQIATIETPPPNSGTMPMQIPTVTCDLASDISTSEAADMEPHPLVYPNGNSTGVVGVGAGGGGVPLSITEAMGTLSPGMPNCNNKETLKVSTITTGRGALNVPVPPSMAAAAAGTTAANNNNNGSTVTAMTTVSGDSLANTTTTTIATTTGATALSPNELRVSPTVGRCRALSVGIDTDMVSEFDPSSSDSGVVSRCAVVKPLKFRLCQPIFGRKSNHQRRNEAKSVAVVKTPLKPSDAAKVATELEPAIPKVQKPRDPEKEKRRIARKKEKRATLILGLIMGSFIACWLPFFFLYILMPACRGHCHVPDSAFAIAFWLGYMNSALNPAIYTIFNKDFRRAFRRILFK